MPETNSEFNPWKSTRPLEFRRFPWEKPSFLRRTVSFRGCKCRNKSTRNRYSYIMSMDTCDMWILLQETFQWVPIFHSKGWWIDTGFTGTIWHPNWKVQVSLNWLFQRLEPPNRLLEKENHLNQTSILWLQHVNFSGCTWRIIPGRRKWLG